MKNNTTNSNIVAEEVNRIFICHLKTESKRCVSISLLNFTLFHDTDEFYSCFHLREDTRNTIYTDKMEFHVVELPKLPKELQEDSSDILLWAKFINAEKKRFGIIIS